MHKPTHSGITTRRAQFDCEYRRESLKSGREWSKHHCSLSAPPPRMVSQRGDQRYPAPGTPKAPPLYVTGQDQKKKAQMKEQIKAPEIIQLSSEQIANLPDAQFKTLVIRMLTELVDSGRKLDEIMKAMLRETKENVQGTNSDGKETGTQINTVDQKEERNIQPEKNKETRIQKNDERLRNHWDNFKCSNI